MMLDEVVYTIPPPTLIFVVKEPRQLTDEEMRRQSTLVERICNIGDGLRTFTCEANGSRTRHQMVSHYAICKRELEDEAMPILREKLLEENYEVIDGRVVFTLPEAYFRLLDDNGPESESTTYTVVRVEKAVGRPSRFYWTLAFSPAGLDHTLINRVYHESIIRSVIPGSRWTLGTTENAFDMEHLPLHIFLDPELALDDENRWHHPIY